MAVDENRLIEMSIDAALGEKWLDGAENYREGTMTRFVGNPVVCLHAEGIDAINYAEETLVQAMCSHEEYVELKHHAKRIVELTRILHARNKRNNG